MPLTFDALTTHAIVDEIRRRIVGGRVQRVMLESRDSMALEIYAVGERLGLRIDVSGERARLCVVPVDRLRPSDLTTPFLLLLRKWVREARLFDVHQPLLERVVRLDFHGRDAVGEPYAVALFAELMGRRSNAVLVAEDGAIMDAMRRASAQRNPARPIVPHGRYAAPPGQERLDPSAEETWGQLGGSDARRAIDVLTGGVAGFSPLLAREVLFRAGASASTRPAEVEWEAVRFAALELMAPIHGNTAWEPTLATTADGGAVATPYRPEHLTATHALTPCRYLSDAVEQAAFSSAVGERDSGPSATKPAQPLLRAVDGRIGVVERRVAALERSQAQVAEAELHLVHGQAILASLHAIRPGQTELQWEEAVIPLEPGLPPLEVAQAHFREYKRVRQAGARTPALIQQARRELEYLHETRALLELMRDPAAVAAIGRELVDQGVIREPNAERPKKGGPDVGGRALSFDLGDGFVARVGTSARGNERVTFDLAAPEDIWLHARQIPGAHVILRTAGREPPPGVLRGAARIAAHYCRSREGGRVPVDWTERKHVRKIRGGPPGLVSYVGERTLIVEPGLPHAAKN
jgi:predicted ribosome quality control (RQC) complex YloA/Tae2 family protein